jgi:2-C-methyl-D-erythritol 4-phosphate cytidylyltransferase/2-C-methyl-D-erythritol 2,4-cyclodiphosphate synthase
MQMEHKTEGDPSIIALIVAAGRGQRAGGGLPKQYRPLPQKPDRMVLSQTLTAFIDHEKIDHVIVIIHPDDQALYAEAIGEFADCAKLLPPIHGGATRQASVRNGLDALQPYTPDLVLIHDAARPYISANLISNCLQALAHDETLDGTLPAIAASDTVKRVEGGKVSATLARDTIYFAQTPQGFRFDKIHKAHLAASQQADHEASYTDDASIGEAMGLSIAILPGEAQNIKLTQSEDFQISKNQAQTGKNIMRYETRIGSGFDVHKLDAIGSAQSIFLCGVEVAHERSLIGHSDADVALHALTDAIFGAMGDGDIGEHFPPSDATHKGRASHEFLRFATDQLRKKSGRLVNIDVTLICEAPKISPYRDAMRQRLAEILEIDLARISVKATTTETLGFTGRREGIAAQASVSVELPYSAAG